MAAFTRLIPAPDKRYPPTLCPGCPIIHSRRVGNRGTIDSPLCIILEAPGSEELKAGAPIVGASGDLLDRCVPEDFDFDQAYIINAMQCRPPKTDDQNKDKEFKSRAVSACRARVLEQVFAYPRKAILALGNWSNSALTAEYNFKITTRRGEPYAILSPQGEEVVVVPAVHPAYLLRGSGNLQSFKDDCRLAVEMAFDHRLTVRQHNWEDPQYALLETPTHVQWLIEEYKNAGQIEVAADIETGGLQPSDPSNEILALGFYRHQHQNSDTAYIIPGENLSSSRYRAAVKRLLGLRNVRYIWQFGKFDERFLAREKLIARSILSEDTGLLSYALSEATKDHDLDEQAKNDLGAPDHKQALHPWTKGKKDVSYRVVPRPVLYDYLAKDLKKTQLVWEVKRPLVAADPHLERLYTQTLLPSSRLLAQVEAYGIAVDWDYVRINRSGATPEDLSRGLVKSLEDEPGFEGELVRIQAELTELVGYAVNPNSPDEVATLLYNGYGLQIKGRRPKDTRKETLDKLPPHPAVALIKRYRSTTKMLSTYVVAIERLAIDGVIHTSFKQHVTPTGRLSSSEPNIQNIPRMSRLKRMYRARIGMKLLEGDYNSAELRMLAVLSQDRFLTEVFLDDKRNLHDEVSVSMYGPNWTQDQRIRAKAVNFGIPYGREAFSIAEEYDMETPEAQRLIDAWFARAPEAAAFLKKARSAPSQGRTLITVFGRKRRPGVVSAERAHGLMNEFANFNMQSPISDFTLHSGIKMLPRLRKEGAMIVNLIHDSVLIEFPDDSREREQQVAGIVKETMENVPKLWITTPIVFRVDIKVGTHWGLLQSYKQ